MIIQVKNKRLLALLLVGIILGLAYFESTGYLNLNAEGEISLFLIILWILSLFIKLEVKNARTNKRKCI